MKPGPNPICGAFLVGVLTAISAVAFPNEECTPFPANARPQQIKIHDFPSPKSEREPVTENLTLTFQDTAEGHEIVLRMGMDEMDLIIDGQSVIADKSGGSGGSPFFSLSAGDLNQDGILDFILDHWQGGNGWVAGGEMLTFFLSTGNTYGFASVLSHYPRNENFVMLGGKPCLIHTSIGEAGSPDGKCLEYYYVHNILVFDGTSLYLANSLHTGFPMLISSHMNCDTAGDAQRIQTVLDTMTAAQKDELIQEAMRGIFK
jgi:hypothetical protein